MVDVIVANFNLILLLATLAIFVMLAVWFLSHLFPTGAPRSQATGQPDPAVASIQRRQPDEESGHEK